MGDPRMERSGEFDSGEEESGFDFSGEDRSGEFDFSGEESSEHFDPGMERSGEFDSGDGESGWDSLERINLENLILEWTVHGISLERNDLDIDWEFSSCFRF